MNDSELMLHVPEPAVEHETDPETDRIVLRKPRYGKGWLGRLLTRRLANPFVKVHLDDLGTWVWSRCDGEATLDEIASQMAGAFPGEDHPERRLLLFVRQLVGTGLLRLRRPAADDS